MSLYLNPLNNTKCQTYYPNQLGATIGNSYSSSQSAGWTFVNGLNRISNNILSNLANVGSIYDKYIRQSPSASVQLLDSINPCGNAIVALNQDYQSGNNSLSGFMGETIKGSGGSLICRLALPIRANISSVLDRILPWARSEATDLVRVGAEIVTDQAINSGANYIAGQVGNAVASIPTSLSSPSSFEQTQFENINSNSQSSGDTLSDYCTTDAIYSGELEKAKPNNSSLGPSTANLIANELEESYCCETPQIVVIPIISQAETGCSSSSKIEQLGTLISSAFDKVISWIGNLFGSKDENATFSGGIWNSVSNFMGNLFGSSQAGENKGGNLLSSFGNVLGGLFG